MLILERFKSTTNLITPPVYININIKNVRLSHSTRRNAIKIMLLKLLTPNIQRIKSICAIGAMLQQVLL